MRILRKWTNFLSVISLVLGLCALTVVVKDLADGKGMNWKVAGLIPLSAAYLYFRAREKDDEVWESPYQVEMTGTLIRSIHPEGKTEEIRLEDIQEVRIITTDEGPWLPDVWILLVKDEKHGCSFPSDARGHHAVIDYILELPGCDHAQFIKAMGDTSNSEYLIWRKELVV